MPSQPPCHGDGLAWRTLCWLWRGRQTVGTAGQRLLPVAGRASALHHPSSVVVNRIIDMIAGYTVRSPGAGTDNRSQAAAIIPCAAAAVSRSSNRCIARVTNALSDDCLS